MPVRLPVARTRRHELVLCTNHNNLLQQNFESNATKKGVVPARVFRRMLESHARRRRQAQQTATAAVGTRHTLKAKHKPTGAGGTRDWLRKKAATAVRLGRMVDDPELKAPRRSKRLIKCMPEPPAADSDTGKRRCNAEPQPSDGRHV